MHSIFKALSLIGLSMVVFACSDWTDAEALQMTQYSNTEIAKKETYYQALREWKKTKHSISFGWFGGWSNPGASTTNMLAGLPDSMDVVSLWDNSTNLTEGKKKDLEFVQKVKGTKVLFCSFTRYVGQHATPKEYDTDEATRNKFWGWESGNVEKQESAVRKYANALIDTINKYHYDGFDIDFEPHYGYGGELASNNDLMHVFITELGKSIGPKSPNPEKLLIVDGEPQTLHAKTAPYISYYVIQAYFAKEANLDGRLQIGLDKFKSVITRDGHATPYRSLEGFARWQPLNGYMKGGFGAYHIDGEAVNNPSYKYFRRAIQAQNPAVR